MYLYYGSRVSASINQITHNHARRGGGIYVEDEITVTTIPCFFQAFNLQLPCLAIDVVITLENTTADEAGSAVYGGTSVVLVN